MEESAVQTERCPEGEDEFERPIVTNLARHSIVEYHLAPAFPHSAYSSIDDLDRISNAGSSGSSKVPSSRSSPIPFPPTDSKNTQATSESLRNDTTLNATPSGDTEHCPPTIIIVNPRGEALYPRASEEDASITAEEIEAKSPKKLADNSEMASPRSKSPRPVTPKSGDKEESFWDKFGTLGRKKRIKEVQVVEEEGKKAIDSPGSPLTFDISPEEYDLAEGEERLLIERRSYEDPKLRHLIQLLVDWINDELAEQRIIVKNMEDDLYDGQVLQKLLEKLTGQKLEVPEVTQSEEGQRQKLRVVLGSTNQILGLPRWSSQKWSVESIHSKSLVAILYLLVHLARHFRAPLRLPENVNVETVVVKKRNGKLEYRRVTEELTSTYDEFGMRCERDAFDALLDHAPDKLQVVKKSLLTFVNKHLNRINLEVNEIESQFHDGVYLVLLMGLLENYFVPLFEFHLTPKDFEQKVFNVAFAFELMQDAGLAKPKARPEDVVNLDLKSTLRVLYNLFAKYRNVA